MKPRSLVLLLSVLTLLCWAGPLPAQQIETYMSPRGGCAAAIARELATATQSIDVAAYILSYKPLAEELLRAHARGVRVRVIVDRVQEVEPAPVPKLVRAAGIAIKTDRREKLFHHKYAIIDGITVATGSYNWSNNAELENAECLLIVRHPPTAQRFRIDFEQHWTHSQAYIPRVPHRKTSTRVPR